RERLQVTAIIEYRHRQRREVHRAPLVERGLHDHRRLLERESRHGVQASSAMTQRARRPAATRWMLSKPFRNLAAQFSHVGPAECGVSVTFGSVNSGWFGAGGSSTITSRPAAAIWPWVSAR